MFLQKKQNYYGTHNHLSWRRPFLFITFLLLCTVLQIGGALASASGLNMPEAVPTVVLRTTDPLYRWHVDDGFIYYCNHGDNLRRRALNGNVSIQLSQPCNHTNYLVSDDQALFYYDSNDGQIETIPLNQPNATPTVVYSLAGYSIHDLDIQGNYVYWVEKVGFDGSKVVRRVRKSGGTVNTLYDGALGNPRKLAVSGSYLYWTTAAGLSRRHLPSYLCHIWVGGCPAEYLHNYSNSAADLYVGDNNFVSWWGTGRDDGINRIFATECNASSTCPTNERSYDHPPAWSTMQGITHDDEGFIYFMENGRLQRIDHADQVITLAEVVGSDIELVDDELYFLIDDRTLGKLGTDATPITRDIRLLDMEANQSIQSVENDVALIAGKETVVRVYAQVSTGENAGAVEAILRGYDEYGVELPDSPIYPIQRTRPVRRRGLSARQYGTYGWFFPLPSAWINPTGEPIPQEDSILYLLPQIDPRELLQDSDRSNNTLAQPRRFDLVAKAPTCVHARPVWTDKGLISLFDPNVAATFTLAERMLPTANLLMFPDSDPLRDFNAYYQPIPYVLSERWPWLLGRLGYNDFWHDFPDEECNYNNARTLTAGIVDTNATWGTTNGVARPGGDQFISKVPHITSISDLGNFWSQTQRATTLAHEIAHNYGRKHVNCDGTEENVDKDYPYLNSSGEADKIDNNPRKDRGTHFGLLTGPNRVMDAHTTRPLLGYCYSRWLSDYNYTAIFDETRDPIYESWFPRRPVAETVALIGGMLDRDLDQATIDPIFQVPAALASDSQLNRWQAEMQQTRAPGATGTIRFLDGDGNIIASEPLTIPEVTDNSANTVPFSAVVNWPQTPVSEVQILDGENVLGTITAGVATPTVFMSAPTGNETVASTITMRFTVTDADAEDELAITLQYSPDMGDSWYALFVNAPLQEGGWQQMTVDLTGQPGSDGRSALLRLFVSDGLHSAHATSAPFAVDGSPPAAVIISPSNGAWLKADEPLLLSGTGYDPEDLRLARENLMWEIDGTIATGRDVYMSGLAPGQYETTLTVTDGDGQSDTAAVSFHVTPLSLTENPSTTFDLDGYCADDAYGLVNGLPLESYGDGTQASVYLSRTADDLWLCVGRMAPGDSQVSLLVDMDNSGGGTLQAGDMRFFVRNDGTPGVELVESGSEFTAAPLDNLVARIVADETGWSAEFRIGAAAFTSWQKQVRLSVIHSVEDPAVATAWPRGAIDTVPASWATTNLSAAPDLIAVEPLTMTLGTGEVVLHVSGNNFDQDTEIVWNGSAIATTLVSPEEVTGVVDTNTLPESALYPISLADSTAPAIASLPINVTVYNPIPVLNSVEPNSLSATGTDVPVVLTGSQFVDGAAGHFNGEAVPTQFIDATTLHVVLPAAALEGISRGILAVTNPPFSLQPSNSLTVDVIQLPDHLYLPIIVR